MAPLTPFQRGMGFHPHRHCGEERRPASPTHHHGVVGEPPHGRSQRSHHNDAGVRSSKSFSAHGAPNTPQRRLTSTAAGFIRDVFHLELLANSVILPKANDKLRMCVDYTDLNKECPKDPFPLPRIDQVVDSTTGCSFVFCTRTLVPPNKHGKGERVENIVYHPGGNVLLHTHAFRDQEH